MKFFTQTTIEFLARILKRKILVRSPQRFLFSPAISRKIMMRITITFAFLITAFLQLSLAQNIIKGKVTDDKGLALPGVSVQLKGKDVGVTTDKDGAFTINADDKNGTLMFSYVGFTTQEIGIKGRSSIDVSLSPESKALSDVVVVGYGKQKKVNLVGAVSSVNIDEKLTSGALPNI